MSRKTGRAIAASCALGALAGAGILIYTVAAGGGGAAAQAMPDVGKFRAGSELGMERAGFSGRAMVQIFVDEDTGEEVHFGLDLRAREALGDRRPFERSGLRMSSPSQR